MHLPAAARAQPSSQPSSQPTSQPTSQPSSLPASRAASRPIGDHRPVARPLPLPLAGAPSRQPAALPTVRRAPGVVAGQRPLCLGGTLLCLWGFVQAQYTHDQLSEDQLADGDGQPLNQDQFLVRRARLVLTGASAQLGALPWIEYDVQVAFDRQQPGFRVLEAALAWRPPARWGVALPLSIRLGAGVFQAPFGYQVYQQDDSRRLFVERGLAADAFFPGQLDTGARLTLALDWSTARDPRATRVALDLAVQNGEPLAGAPYPHKDPNAGKDLLARATLRTPLARWLLLEAGLSAMFGRGFSPGTAPTKDTLVWRDLNEDGIVQPSELRSIPGAAGQPSASFDRWGVEGDVRASIDTPVLGRTLLFFEVALAANLDRAVRPSDPVLLGRDQRQLGLLAALTQNIGRYFMIGFRFDMYRPEIDSTDLQGGTVVRADERFLGYTIAGAVRYTVGRFRMRLTLEYRIQDDRLGRDASGLPTDLANNRLTLRLQGVF